MIYTITVAFCPAAQLARSLKEYEKNRSITTDRHIVVMGHYPINNLIDKKKNNRDIQMLCDAFEVECWDPGSDLGSAQSQNWALERINPADNDYWINWDPDTNCKMKYWDEAMENTLASIPDCVAISCWSKMWEAFRNRLIEQKFLLTPNNSINIGGALQPIPFNLTMFRCSFIKQIGGLHQMGEKWGELEAPFHAACEANGKYHAYLMDYIEEESGKFMQDRQLLEYKDAYMRTIGENNFRGSFEEYLKWKYPELVEMDTYIVDNTEFK